MSDSVEKKYCSVVKKQVSLREVAGTRSWTCSDIKRCQDNSKAMRDHQCLLHTQRE